MDYLLSSAAVLLWTAVLLRWRMLRGTQTDRSLWSVLLCFAVAVSMLNDPMRQQTVVGPVTSFLYAFGTFSVSVLACAATRSLVLSTTDLPSRRATVTNATLAVAAITAGGVSYVLAPPLDGMYASLSQSPQQAGLAGPFLRSGAFLAYLGWALAGMLRVTRTHARGSSDDVRAGLTLGAIGCGIGFGFIALEAAVVVLWAGGAAASGRPADAAAKCVALVSMSFIVAGVLRATVARPLRAAVHWCWELRAQRRLDPLWVALRQAAPKGAADLALVMVGHRVRLVRTVIEIRDRQRILCRYVSPDLCTAALTAAHRSGLEGSDAAAAAEAAWTEVARRALLAGLAPRSDVGAAAGQVAAAGGHNLDGEVHWLERVSTAWRDCELVAEFADAHEARSPAMTGVTR